MTLKILHLQSVLSSWALTLYFLNREAVQGSWRRCGGALEGSGQPFQKYFALSISSVFRQVPKSLTFWQGPSPSGPDFPNRLNIAPLTCVLLQSKGWIGWTLNVPLLEFPTSVLLLYLLLLNRNGLPTPLVPIKLYPSFKPWFMEAASPDQPILK